MKNYVAYFKVKCWEENDNDKIYCGFISADNYADAANQIEEYFHDELVSMELELLDTSLMVMTEEQAQDIMKFNF